MTFNVICNDVIILVKFWLFDDGIYNTVSLQYRSLDYTYYCDYDADCIHKHAVLNYVNIKLLNL